jgi:ribosomal-protein-alanine N-acetyltransferase
VGRAAADEAEIITVAVAPECQRRGLGGSLVSALVDAAGAKGLRRVFLEVAESNAAARNLYQRAGFSQVGLRRGYYVTTGGPTEDALVLRLDLPQNP